MPRTNFDTLLEAGHHLGHLKRKQNPVTALYIFTKRSNICIIDLNKMAVKIGKAAEVLKQVAKSRKKVLFIATKKQAKQVVANKAASINISYVAERQLDGMLTSFPTIYKAVRKMATIDRLTNDGIYSNPSKRETLQVSRQRAKLDKTLGFIVNLTRLPSALFAVDVMKENIAAHEASRLGVPIFSIVDTNPGPANTDFVIPANGDAIKPVEVILDAYCTVIQEGPGKRKVEKVDMEVAGGAPTNKGKKKATKARPDRPDGETINAAKAAAFTKEDEKAQFIVES